jgi:hypothetical protein
MTRILTAVVFFSGLASAVFWVGPTIVERRINRVRRHATWIGSALGDTINSAASKTIIRVFHPGNFAGVDEPVYSWVCQNPSG